MTLGATPWYNIDWLGLLALLSTAAVVLWTIGVLHVRWLLRHPPRMTDGWALARGAPTTPAELTPARDGVGPRAFTEWRLRHGTLDIPIWDIPGDAPGGVTVIVIHGWGESRLAALPRLEALLPHARRVLAMDLPGHGGSGGVTSLGRDEASFLPGIIEACDGPVVFMGKSMGAGIALDAAARDRSARVVGVIAEAPYRMPGTPAGNVLSAQGMPTLGLLETALVTIGGVAWQREGSMFDRAVIARNLKRLVPVLVIHGELDPVSPPADGRAIAEACGGEVRVIEHAKHNDVWSSSCRVSAVEAVSTWLERRRKSPLRPPEHATPAPQG